MNPGDFGASAARFVPTSMAAARASASLSSTAV